ncbi:unnamed protein product [Acanthosepion pharaonis]|uniref:Uncharacterized protein n=1 Tax=Acanthosepion pharaonis TaxID=158019 RepID=A0A812C9C5_ACAPH|nr:unnamed protein product [Sepia pharaonis]
MTIVSQLVNVRKQILRAKWRPSMKMIALLISITLSLSLSLSPPSLSLSLSLSVSLPVLMLARLYHRCGYSRLTLLLCPLYHRCVRLEHMLSSAVSITNRDTQDSSFCSALSIKSVYGWDPSSDYYFCFELYHRCLRLGILLGSAVSVTDVDTGDTLFFTCLSLMCTPRAAARLGCLYHRGRHSKLHVLVCLLYHGCARLLLLLIFPITVVNGWEPYSVLLSLSPMWTLEISFSTLPTISPMFTVGSSASLYRRCEHSRHPLFPSVTDVYRLHSYSALLSLSPIWILETPSSALLLSVIDVYGWDP